MLHAILQLVLVGTLDEQVKKIIKGKSDAGLFITKSIVKATATAIVKYHMPHTSKSLLPITDAWAKSMLSRMNMVKHKGMLTRTNLF